MSCRLISESMNLVFGALVDWANFYSLSFKVIVNEGNAHDTQEFLTKRLSAIKSQRSTGELEDLALVIGTFPDYDILPLFSLFSLL